MPHPVPPPPPPAIVQPLQPETLTPPGTSNQNPTATDSLAAKALSTPTAPEILAPEPSTNLSAGSGAALLGPPLSISDSQQQVEANIFSNGSNLDAPAAPASTKTLVIRQVPESRQFSLSQTEAPSVVETEAGNQQEQAPSVVETEAANQQEQEQQQIQIDPENSSPPSPAPEASPTPPPQPNTTNQPEGQPPGSTTPASTPPGRERIIELTSDRQQYDEQRRIVTAEGNVILRFDGAVVDADRLQVNLDNLIAVGEGNVALTRGQQVLRGQRFTYNFIQDTGDLQNARGDIYVPSAGSDFTFGLPTDLTAGNVPPRPPSDRITSGQILQNVSSPGGVGITVGSTRNIGNIPLPQQGGQVRRMRFEAEQIDFTPGGWQANNVRITNDPFSPPELELRADKVTLTRETPLRDRIKTERQRLVLDQGLTVPIPKDEQVIDRTEREVTPGLVSFGYDADKRGGVYAERTFKPIDTDRVRLSVTPQFFVQEAVQNGFNAFDPAVYGLRTSLNAVLSPSTVVEGAGILTSLNLNDVEDNLRASLRLRQRLGNTNPHTLTLEYSYRNRLYNGTLGYQTVQSSFGGVITSPIIALGKTGVNLSYQAGAQYINAETDRLDLLEPVRENNRASLSRLQASAAVSRGFLLWQGKGLAPTATEGLRYTPNPVVPYVQAFAGVTGTTSYYGNGDNQSSLIGTIGVQGQFGHFSRSFLDYTGFNISYSQGINTGESPFLFDRAVDNQVLSAGILQQIYGPFRLGFQTSLNLDTSERISTDYYLEYSRRTYGVTLRYNPILELGSLSFRISDFNWSGGTNPFSEVSPVTGGVRQRLPE